MLVRRDKAALAEFDHGDCDLDYAATLVSAAFDVALTRHYGIDTPVHELTLLASGVRQFAGGEASPPVLHMEMVLRAGLGERVPIADLSVADVVAAKGQLLSQLVHRTGMLDSEIDALLAAALRLGYEPSVE
jgi:hypothetical protein